MQSNSIPHNSEPLNRIRKKCNRINESFRRRIISGEVINSVRTFTEKKLIKLNFEDKQNTNWRRISDIERIIISKCETMDHSGKDCHHKTSRKLLIAITREKHSCSDGCDENKDYKKRKSNEGPIKQFESYGQKPEHINNEQSRHSSKVKWSKTYENEGSSYTD